MCSSMITLGSSIRSLSKSSWPFAPYPVEGPDRLRLLVAIGLRPSRWRFHVREHFLRSKKRSIRNREIPPRIAASFANHLVRLVENARCNCDFGSLLDDSFCFFVGHNIHFSQQTLGNRSGTQSFLDGTIGWRDRAIIH